MPGADVWAREKARRRERTRRVCRTGPSYAPTVKNMNRDDFLEKALEKYRNLPSVMEPWWIV